MRIGIFSGTFDPIHSGHLSFVKSAKQLLNLDKVLILIEKDPRRKKSVSDYNHRLNMVKLALKNEPNFIIEDLDMQKAGKTHTLKETMEELYKEFGTKTEFVLLMGGDLFEYIESWEDLDEYLGKLSFGVGLRTEDDGELCIELASRIGAKIKLIQSPQPSTSSAKIKQKIIAGDTSSELPKEVSEYIKENSLYEQQTIN